MLEGPNVLSSLKDLSALSVLEGLAKLHRAVFAADGEGRLIWISDGLGALRGVGASQTGVEDEAGWRAARPTREYFAHPEQLEEIRQRFARDGAVHAALADLLDCQGAVVPVEIDAVKLPTRDAEARDAEADGVLVGIVRPVAEREDRTREQRETAAFLSGVLASSPAPVLACDRRGFITYVNPAIGRLLGFSSDELLEKPVGMLAASPERLAAAIVGPPEARGHETELRHADGSARHVVVSASELRLGDGSVSGSVVVLHDQTEEHRIREELGRKEAELRRKNSELEHYVQNVTHDLRSPLVSLLGFSRLLRQEYGEGFDETARHFLDRIEKAGHTMETLINDLLELSRIESTQQYNVHVNVNDVLHQLQAELKPRLESQGARLTLPAEPPVVVCDRTRLYQVFSNLIGNALDYMGPVDSPEIRIDVFEEPGEHHIVVRDNGRGVEVDQRERIFELFQSAGPRADGRRGTGIGLAIVKKIVQSQGGRVWVEGNPGQGAAFHLTLPLE